MTIVSTSESDCGVKWDVAAETVKTASCKWLACKRSQKIYSEYSITGSNPNVHQQENG